MTTDTPSRQPAAIPAFAGSSRHAYIKAVRTPIPGYRVDIALPDAPGRYRYKTFCSWSRDPNDLMAEAIAWRDKMLLRMTGKIAPVRAFHKQQCNSNTGFPGISKIVKIFRNKTQAGLREYKIPCIIANICLTPGKNGKRATQYRSRLFSLNKYSEADALLMAVAWREAWVAKLTWPDAAG